MYFRDQILLSILYFVFKILLFCLCTKNSARIFHNLLVMYLVVLCVGLNDNCLPQSLAFENLVPSWWLYLLRLMRNGLEGTSLEAGFES